MKEKIGFIGLGRMGIPMVNRLLEGGYPVTVYNRTPGKGDFEAQNVRVALSAAELMKLSEVIIVMVSNDQAIRDVFTGTGGLLSAGVSDKVIVNMSTVSAQISREMAELCAQQGNRYLDAPVAGSVKQVETGTLVVMAGGNEDVFLQVKPIFDQLSKLAIHVGEVGAGNSAKLAVNTLLGIMSQGLAEVVLFGKSNNIQPQDLLNIIHNSAMGNTYMKIKGDAILQDNFQAAFALKHIVKDLGLAKQSGLNTPLGELAYKTFQEAEGKYGEEDIISVFKMLSLG